MYPYSPYPYPPPVYGPPPRARTPQGIRWSIVGLFLALGYFLVSALVGVLLMGLFSAAPPTTLDGLLALLGGILAASLLAAILGILLLVFYFIGFGFLYGGRNEFGPTHARNLKVSLILLILAISFGVANPVATGIIGSQAIRFIPGGQFGGTWEVNPDMFYLAAGLGAVLGIVVAALVAAHLVLSVRVLAKPRYGPVLYVAAALGTATPGIVGSLTLLQMARFIVFVQTVVESQTGGFGVVPAFDSHLGTPMIVGGVLGAIAMALYLWVYWDVANRLRTGELKSVLPPPQPAAPWMPAPVVPPSYPYPVPPVQPAGPHGPPP